MATYFCERCEEEVDETKFTMDKDGEVCDDCITSYGELQHDAWKEQELEIQIEKNTEK